MSEARVDGLVVVVASGEAPPEGNAGRASHLDRAELVIAADGGLANCAPHRWPDIIVGDLDSAAPDTVARAEANGALVIRHSVDKDATDLELAFDEAVRHGAKRLEVLCAFGGRLDHELGAIALLAADRWRHLAPSAHDGTQSVFVVHDELNLSYDVGTTMSLLPWSGPATGVCAEGFRWPLSDAELLPGTTIGVSNRTTDSKQRVTTDSGVVLVVVSGDR